MILTFWLQETQNALLTAQMTLANFTYRLSVYSAPFEDKYLGKKAIRLVDVSDANLPLIHFARYLNYLFDTASSKLNFLNLSNLDVDYFVWVFFTLIFTLYIMFFIVLAIVDLSRELGLYKFVGRLAYIAENEFNSSWIIIILFSVMTSTLWLGGLFPIFDMKFPILFTGVITLITFVVLLVFLTPISLLLNWGLYSPIYIRGQSIKKNLIIEFIMDYMHFLSFFLRINIQLIRLVIFSAIFYVYNDMYYEFIYPNYKFSNLDFAPVNLSDYVYLGLQSVIIISLNVLYEIGHFWTLLLMQSNAFGVIVFVITQFLYSAYLVSRIQLFFIEKKLTNKRKN